MRFFVPFSCASALLLGLGAHGRACERAHAEPAAELSPPPATQPALAAEETAEESAEAAPAVPSVAEPEPAQKAALPRPSEATAEPSASKSTPAPGSLGAPEITELNARLQAFERIDPLDDSVRRPVEFARAALERARTSQRAGDAQAELRTLRLARAAVELADARLRLLRERALFLAARARGNASSAEQATAKRALERERARARELERESAAP